MRKIVNQILVSKYTWFLLAGFAAAFTVISFLMLTKYPLQSRDESWFSEMAYYFLQNGTFNSNMFYGIKEAIGGWVGHGSIYYIIESVSFWFFGVGLFQARLPVFIVSLLILFLIYKIAFKLFNKRTALISIILVALSSVFFAASHPFEAHIFVLFTLLLCLFLFLNYRDKYLINILIGLIAMASIEIHWIATIIPCIILLAYIFEYRKNIFIEKRVYLFLSGCLVSFMAFLFYRLYVQNFDLFVYKLNLYYNITKGQSYGQSAIDEITRYYKYFIQGKNFLEFIPMLLTLFIVIKNRSRSGNFLLMIIGAYILLMAFVMKSKNPYFILYFPIFYVLIAHVIDNFLENIDKTKTFILLLNIIVISIIPAFMAKNLWITFKFHKADYNGFVQELKKTIPPDAVVMGPMPLWYGFYSQPYYESLFYIERVLGRDKGLNDIAEEKQYLLKNRAIYDLIKERKVEYLIMDESLKEYLKASNYFKFNGDENKYFKSVAKIDNKYYIGYNRPENSNYYVTEIYKVKNEK